MSDSKHPYDYEVLPGSVGSIVPRMVDGNARVLELGTGPGAITKQLHAKGCRVTGLEIDLSAIELVAPYCERIVQCDLNAPNWQSVVAGERFEAIVMTDVLEHLYDPWKTLATAIGLLGPNGTVIASLPHVGHSAVLASLLNGRFDYQPWGLLDKTHIRFFGLRNMQEMFIGAGLKILDADFVVKLPEQTEFASNWKTLPPAARRALSMNPHGHVYQAIIKAGRADRPGKAIELTDVAPAPYAGAFGTGNNRLLRYIAGHISLKNRERITTALRRLHIHP